MKCYKHYDRDAVAQCIDCGKGLCPECANKYTIPICDQCELKRISSDRQLLIKNSIIMLFLFLFGFFMDNTQTFLERILIGYFFAGIPWGWSFLTSITPNIFLFMSWIGWIMYFVIKLTLAMFIGMFVTPYKLYQVVNGLKRAKELVDYANN